jgi:phage shock protein A
MIIILIELYYSINHLLAEIKQVSELAGSIEAVLEVLNSSRVDVDECMSELETRISARLDANGLE